MKVRVLCICSIFLLINLHSQTRVAELPQPSALFSIVFWGDSKVRSLHYAPWGNFMDLNSTKSKVRGSYGMLSSTCVYYGGNDINFYHSSNDIIGAKKSHDDGEENQYKLATSLSFSATPEKTQKFIALFTPSEKKGEFKSFKIPFSEEEIPWGTFKVISQFKETLYILIKNKRITLNPGKNFFINTLDFEGSRNIQMIVYRNVGGDYKEIGAESFRVSDMGRGIVFLTKRGDRFHTIPLLSKNRSLERAVGYGTKATLETSTDRTTTPSNIRPGNI